MNRAHLHHAVSAVFVVARTERGDAQRRSRRAGCSYEELRTKGCSESDTFLTLHNIGKMLPTVRRDVVKRKLDATGFWWCTVEA